MKPPGDRRQQMTVVYGVLCIVLLLVVMQLWLLTATMNAYLGGDSGVPVPAALFSGLCLLLNAGLLRFLYKLDAAPPPGKEQRHES